MRSLFLFLILLVSAFAAVAQNVPTGFDLSNYGVRIEPDKRVMVVLAALEAARTTNAAGESVPVINTPLSAQGQKFRELLKSDLAALNEDLRLRISTFVLQHKRRNPKATDAEIVAPFISMAYALTPFPELADPVVTTDLPGNLLDVLDFAPLARDFYRRSSFAGNLPDYLKTYNTAADGQLRSSAREMVNELLNYLNTKPQLYYSEKTRVETQKTKRTKLTNIETRERERHFYIVPEMLAPAANVNFLNIKDDYYVILPPETDLVSSDVRRGFLQFVIDPLVLGNSKDIAAMRAGVKQILDERRKIDPTVSPDVFLTISRSLVAAVDARQNESYRAGIAMNQARQRIDRAKTADEKKVISQDLQKFTSSLADEAALRLSEDFDKGAVLDFYFYEQLKGIEDSGFDIASSMREMILSFDPAKETGRYDLYADARKRAFAARNDRKNNSNANTIAENPVTNKLIEIQKTIDSKDYAKAGTDLKLLLDKNPSEPRIFYNIGRVASLSAQLITDAEQQNSKLLEAKTAFENVIRIAQKQDVDPALRSLSYVALAKIYEFFDNKTYALSVYDAAIKIGDVSGGGFKEALAAKARLVKEQ